MDFPSLEHVILAGLANDSFSKCERLLDLPILAVNSYLAGAFPRTIFLRQRNRVFASFSFSDACSVVFFDDPMVAKA